MPEIAIAEDGEFVMSKGEVGLSGHLRVIPMKPQSRARELDGEEVLRMRIVCAVGPLAAGC